MTLSEAPALYERSGQNVTGEAFFGPTGKSEQARQPWGPRACPMSGSLSSPLSDRGGSRLVQVAAQAAHHRTRQTYGAERLRRELTADDGFRVSLGTVKNVRREPGLRCVQRKRPFRVRTTDSGHRLPVAPNLLGQEFTVERPDEVWTADLTYVATAEGWLYVAAIKDLFAGEIVGRSSGKRLTTDLVVRALAQSVAARRPAAGLIHYSDRCSQYCSHGFGRCLRATGCGP